MIFIRSLLFQIAFHLNLLIIGTLFIPWLILPKRYAAVPGRAWARTSLDWLKLLCGTSHKFHNIELLQKAQQGGNKGIIIASKHQSAWDTIVFFLLLDKPIYVLKKELTYFPILGWYVRKMGCIAVNRSKGAAAMRNLVSQAEHYIENGYQLVIFPEGTRVRTSERKPLQSGLWAIFQATKAPIVTVSLNAGFYWARGSFLRRPGCITLAFTHLITDAKDKHSLLAEVDKHIQTHAGAPSS